MKNEFLIKLVILTVFLIYSNPSRAQLDSRLLGTFNHNFVKGVARYFKVNFGGNLRNCLIFSYLYVGRTGYYVGIGGMWIGPHYWSTLSGWVALAMFSLGVLKIVRFKTVNDVFMLIISLLFFVFFSETVETKMGRTNMAAFIATSVATSLGVIYLTSSRIKLFRDISIHQITRACASAFLCYLAKAANSPNKFFVMDGIVVQKTFEWKGLQIDYSQYALYCEVILELVLRTSIP